MRKQKGKVQDLKFKELFCSQCISVDTNIAQAASPALDATARTTQHFFIVLTPLAALQN